MSFPGAAGAADGGGGDDGRMLDLSSSIETSDCFARNEAPGFPMSNLFIGDSRLGCKSDADEQLILHVSFHDFVKVRCMCVCVYRRWVVVSSLAF
jgi:PITH domain